MKGSIEFGFHILPNLVGRMATYVMHEYILDVGSLENYRQAEQDRATIGAQT